MSERRARPRLLGHRPDSRQELNPRAAPHPTRPVPVRSARREVCTREPVRSALRAALGHDDWRRLPLGALLGTVELIDCTPVENDSPPSAWAWELGNPEPLPQPIPYRGCLGIFEVPDDFFSWRQAAALVCPLAAPGGPRVSQGNKVG